MAWVDYLFNGMGDKTNQLTRLVPSTDAKIKESIRPQCPHILQNQSRILSDQAQSLKVFIIKPRSLFLIGPC